MATIEITIPVLDEEATLESQIDQVVAYLDEHVSSLGDVRIVIADNGSSDGTPEVCASLTARHKCVSVVRLEERGVGRALKASWTRSEADIVGYMDLDLATDLKHLHEALKSLVDGEADVVTGSRLLPASKVHGRSLLRATTSRVFNLIVKFYMGTKFSDGMCGFKFLDRRYLQSLMSLGATNDGWFFATELLVCAEFSGLRVIDLPVEWTDDPNTKARITSLTREYLISMRRLKRRLEQSNVQVA